MKSFQILFCESVQERLGVLAVEKIMENHDLVLNTLQEYTTDELFYREYYYARISDDPDDMKSFLSRHSPAEINQRRLICPEMFGKTLDTIEYIYLDEHPSDGYLTFEGLYTGKLRFSTMGIGNNVRIEKHNRYSPGFFHSHEFFEAFYVLTGQCTHFINGKKEILKKGTLCFISPDVRHKIEVFDDSIIMNILMQKSTFDDIFFNVIRSQTILSAFFLSSLTKKNRVSHLTFILNDSELEDILLSMYLEELTKDSYTNRLLILQLSLFFMKLVRKYERTAVSSQTDEAMEKNHFQMLSYISDHYKDITLSELADHFHYTHEYCSRLIRQISGQTFQSLLKEIRLRHAESLLLTTSLSIDEISHMVGYENAGTLINVFKKELHTTPGQYRKDG